MHKLNAPLSRISQGEREGEGKLHLEFLMELCHLVLQILNVSKQTKMHHFQHPFSLVLFYSCSQFHCW